MLLTGRVCFRHARIETWWGGAVVDLEGWCEDMCDLRCCFWCLLSFCLCCLPSTLCHLPVGWVFLLLAAQERWGCEASLWWRGACSSTPPHFAGSCFTGTPCAYCVWLGLAGCIALWQTLLCCISCVSSLRVQLHYIAVVVIRFQYAPAALAPSLTNIGSCSWARIIQVYWCRYVWLTGPIGSGAARHGGGWGIGAYSSPVQ